MPSVKKPKILFVACPVFASPAALVVRTQGTGDSLLTTFIALYHGQTVNSARILAVSADPHLVAGVANELLLNGLPETSGTPNSDPIENALWEGRQKALRLVKTESADAAP